jgi:hypothetical protein
MCHLTRYCLLNTQSPKLLNSNADNRSQYMEEKTDENGTPNSPLVKSLSAFINQHETLDNHLQPCQSCLTNIKIISLLGLSGKI